MIELQTKNITKTYGCRTIIKDIDIKLYENESVALLGVSGAGKTTIFNIISGILNPDRGQVFLKEKDITGIPGNISYMLQKDLLLPYKTIADNVSLPLIVKGKSKKEAIEEVRKYLEEFGLAGTENKYPLQLSRRNETKSSTT